MKRFFRKLFPGTKEAFWEILKDHLLSEKRMFLVTANPEIFMLGKSDPQIGTLLLDEATTMTADGIGLVKGGKMIGMELPERIPGVEIAKELMGYGHEYSKSIFLLGAKQEVIDALCGVIEKEYPNLNICGAVNGYVQDKDAVFEDMKKLAPDIVLVALGMPAQEKLIYKHLRDFTKGIFVGVGGSFDVLSGMKQRAPQFFIKHNLEWLYRIAKEPSRIKRFYNGNIKFLFAMRKERKQ
jgi:N-acetylglucosaminyldiphosphoundecaprenol N-acetyl-beta-D-mannosaminyltransferase